MAHFSEMKACLLNQRVPPRRSSKNFFSKRYSQRIESDMVRQCDIGNHNDQQHRIVKHEKSFGHLS